MKKLNYSSVEIEGIDMRDYPDFCDAFMVYAEYEDGTVLNEQEMEDLENDGVVNELIHDRQLYL